MNYRHNKRRGLFAIILLMVMTLQMGVKGFHVHRHAHAVKVACSDCEHHRVHGGHIVAWDGNSDNCPLCQVVANPYVEGSALCLDFSLNHNADYGTSASPYLLGAEWGARCPRGPPALS